MDIIIKSLANQPDEVITLRGENGVIHLIVGGTAASYDAVELMSALIAFDAQESRNPPKEDN